MAHRLPSLLINRLPPPAAAIAVTLPATIRSGRLVCEFQVPSPRAPEPLLPMAHRLPSFLRNRLWRLPAAIAVTLLATICSGRLTLLVVPLPNRPSML